MHNKDKSCPLFQKGMYIEKVSENDMLINMCCYQKQENKVYQEIDFLNNQNLSRIRKKQNERVNECDLCYDLELKGAQSYRQGQILAFQQNNIEINDAIELVSLTYNCENVCNLKCITCGPRYSSSWLPEYKKLNYPVRRIKKSTHKNKAYQSIDVSKLKLLHFQGGEPLLTEDHENILKKIEKEGSLSDLTLSYNTNGTVFPSQTTIELWKKTKITKIYFSIDAIGSQFEYIRFPANWKDTEQNIFKIRDLNIPTLWVEIGITVSIANLFYLQDIINWRNERFPNLNTGDPVGIYITFAGDTGVGGKSLSLENLPLSAKKHAIEYLNTLSDTNIASRVINYLNKTNLKTDTTDWKNYLDSIDSLRKNNWKEILFKLYEATKRN